MILPRMKNIAYILQTIMQLEISYVLMILNIFMHRKRLLMIRNDQYY